MPSNRELLAAVIALALVDPKFGQRITIGVAIALALMIAIPLAYHWRRIRRQRAGKKYTLDEAFGLLLNGSLVSYSQILRAVKGAPALVHSNLQSANHEVARKMLHAAVTGNLVLTGRLMPCGADSPFVTIPSEVLNLHVTLDPVHNRLTAHNGGGKEDMVCYEQVFCAADQTDALVPFLRRIVHPWIR